MNLMRWLTQMLVRRRRNLQLEEARQWRQSLEAQPSALLLEPRRVLNAAPVVPAAPPAEVVVNAGKSANDGHADVFVVKNSAAGTTVSVNGQVQHIMHAGERLMIQGSQDGDQVQVDFSQGNPLQNVTVEFDGNGGQDAVQLVGTAQSVTHVFNSDGSAQIVVDQGTLSYTGNVAVTDLVQTQQRTFEFHGDQSVNFIDAPAAGLNEVHAQFGQDVQFAAASSQTVIDAEEDGAAHQEVDIDGLDADFKGDLIVEADALDTVDLAGNVSLGTGNLRVSAGTINVEGQVTTSAADVRLEATSNLAIAAGAQIVDHGGSIVADAGPLGSLLVSGQLDVSQLQPGQVGGAIHLLGNEVQLTGAQIDARGDAGGGTILVGGDYQGKNPDVRDATQTRVDRTTTLNASAISTGDGGKVIVWAEQSTRFTGSISATGGMNQGNGGFAEVSGKSLQAHGTYDLSAPQGQFGTVLFDPLDIVIEGGNGDGSDDTNPQSSRLINDAGSNTLGSILSTDVGTADPFVVFQSEIEGTNANIILQAERSITTDGTFTGGQLTIKNNRNLTLETVNDTHAGDINLTLSAEGANLVIQTQGTGSITIQAATDATPQTANVLLCDLKTEGGDVTVATGKGSITLADVTTTGALDVTATGNINVNGVIDPATVTLTSNDDVIINMAITATDLITVQAGLDGTGLVDLTATGSLTATGGTPADIDISTGATTGSITLDGTVTADGTVRLQAHDDITQSAAITADALGAVSTAGNVDLSLATNDVNTFAAQATNGGAGGKKVNFRDTDGVQLDTVTAGGVFAANISGVNVTTVAGSTVRLRAGNDLTQAAASAVIADVFGAVSDAGNVNLPLATNDVNTFAAAATNGGAGGKKVNFRDTDDVQLGTVTADGVFAANISGVNVTTVAGSTVRLRAGGDLTQAAAAPVIADAFGAVSDTGNVDLPLATNDANTFAAAATNGGAGGKKVNYCDANTVQLGTVTADGVFAANISGVNVTTTAGSTVRLRTNGDLTQTAAGAVIADVFGAVSDTGNVDLPSATNDVNTFAAEATNGGAGGKKVNFRDTDDVQLGTVTQDDVFVADISGVNVTTVAGSTVRLRAGGDLTQLAAAPVIADAFGAVSDAGNVNLPLATNDVNTFAAAATNGGAGGKKVNFRDTDDVQLGTVTADGVFAANISGVNVTTTAGSTVRLRTGGDLTQAAAAPVIADAFGAVSDAGNVDLPLATNDANTFAAAATNGGAGGKKVNYCDANTVQLGTVTADGVFAANISGVNVTTTAGSTVRLRTNGDLTQTAAAPVIANAFGAEATGEVDLCLASNDVLAFAASAGAGTKAVEFHDTVSPDMTATVTADGTLSANLTGITASDFELIVDGDLVIDTQISVTGTVLLRSVNGSVTQTAKILADKLSVQAATFIDLCTQVNNVNEFAAQAGTYVYYRDLDSVTITQITGDAACGTNTLTGIIAGTDAEIWAGMDIVIDEPIQADTTTGTVRLEADAGTVTQIATGSITAKSLSVQADGLIDLCQSTTNDVATFAATSTTSSVYYRDATSFTVDTVMGGTCVTPPQTGVTAATDAELWAGDSLTINEPVQATDVVRLEADTGTVTQNATGYIKADSLSVQANGLIDLCQATPVVNDVATFAATSTNSAVYYHDANSFTVDTVAGGVCVAATVTGVTAGTDAELHAEVDLTIDEPIQAGGVVRLEADTGKVTQVYDTMTMKDGKIVADQLSVHAQGLIDLCQSPNNDVNTFAATSDTSSVYFRDVDDVTIDSVLGGTCVTAGETGVTAAVDAEIHAGTDITINQPIQATDVVRLWGEAGQVTQIAAGKIVADQLSVHAQGLIDLCPADNDVNTFAAFTNSSVRFYDVNSFAIGTVAGGTCVTGAVINITAPTEIDLKTGDSFDVNQALSSGTIRLQSLTGSLTQTAVVTATDFSAQAAVDVDFCTLVNNVTNFAAVATTGHVYYQDADSVTVDMIVGSTCIGDADGIQAGTDAEIHAGTDITINQPIQATDVVRLWGEAGQVTQIAAGKIVADQLSVHADGLIDLCQSPDNDVNTFAATSDTSSVYFRDVDDVTIDSVLGGTCVTADQIGVTAAVDAEIHAGTDITINQPIQATDVVRLWGEAGQVTQIAAGKIVADQLSVHAQNLIDLCQSPDNDVNTFAATSDTSSVYFRDVDDVTIDSVLGGTCVTAGETGVTAAVDAEIHAGTDITINQPIQATGVVRLWGEAGQVTQIAAGKIVADQLSVRANGLIDLCQSPNNDVNTFAATSDTSSVYFRDVDDVTIDSVLGGTCVTADQIGVTAAVDAEIHAGTDITINQPIQATGVVRLWGEAGQVTQIAAGKIIADQLSVHASGLIDLCQSPNNDVNTFAATSDTSSVYFRDVDDVTIDTVTGGTCVMTVQTGVAAGGDIEIRAVTMNLTINEPVQAVGAVRLEADAGQVTQNATGYITADSLSVQANGLIDLCQATPVVNDVATFAATSTTGSVYYHDASSFTVGTVAGGTCVTVAQTGVTATAANQNIELHADGTLTLTQYVKADLATGTVRLQGDTAIAQTSIANGGNGKITASQLSAQSGGDVNLCEVANEVNVVAAVGTGVHFYDDNSTTPLMIGTVAGGICIVNPVADVTVLNTMAGVIDLKTQIDFNLNRPLTAGTVRLQSIQGSLTQSAPAIVTATSFSAQAAVDVDFCTLVNNVTYFAAVATTGHVYYQDADSVTVDKITGNSCIGDADGIQAGTDAEIHAATDITVNRPIQAMGVVRLEADAGTVTQIATGFITADSLSVHASGLIDLCQSPDNDVNTFAATSDTSSVYFRDVDDVTIDTVLGGVCVAADQTGVTALTANQSIELHAGGSLTINEPVQADATTGIVRLEADSGTVTQIAAGKIVADQLSVHASGLIDLCQSLNNDVNTFAATSDTSSVYFRDVDDVTIDSVLGGTCVTAGETGVTAAVDAEIHAGTDITINQPIQATDVVRLWGEAGQVTQIAAGKIVADQLSVHAQNLIDLCQSPDNDVNTFAATSDTSSVYFRDVDDVTIDSVLGGTCVTAGETGVTAAVDAEIHAGTDITINQPIQATDVVRLWGEAGQVTQIAAGKIVADQLSVHADGLIDLCQSPDNDVNTFAATSDTSSVYFRDVDDVTIDSVLGGTCVTADQIGVTAAVDAEIHAGTDITINQPIQATDVVRLWGEAGQVTQIAAGKIVADQLSVHAQNLIDLCQSPDNDVNTFAATSDTSSVYFRDVDDVTIDSVLGGTCVTAGETGVTAAVDAEIHAGTDITINQPIQATGVVRLWGEAGQVTQIAAGKIVADQLSVRANGLIDLCQSPNNDVNTFAATSDTSSVYFRDVDDVTIDSVLGGTCVTADQIGVTAAVDAEIHAGTDITINQPIQATGVVRLWGEAGQVTQIAAGKIVADQLSVHAQGLIDLCQSPNNDVNTFAATSDTSSVYFRDVDDVTIDSVLGGTCVAADQIGVTAAVDAEIHAVTMNITIDEPIQAVGTVRLEADTGTVTQDAAGFITADSLSVQANGLIDLCQSANNDVNTFAATSTTGSVYYHDANSFTVGTVLGGVCVAGAQTGVTATAANQNIELHAGGSLTIDEPVLANTTSGTVRLEGDTGTVTQNATGYIAANALSVQANGLIDLCQATPIINDVTTFAATSTTGSVYYHDANSFTVGMVAGGTCITTNVTGVMAGTDAELHAEASLIIDEPVHATDVVRLLAGTGTVTQIAAGFITADSLSVQANGLIDLCVSANNDVNTFAATSTTNYVYYRDVNDFTVGSVTGGVCITGAQTGVTAATDAELHAGGSLTIDEPVEALGTIRLEATSGNITQNSAGFVKAPSLSAKANGFIDLCQSNSNDVTTFAATSTTSYVYYHDANDFTIGTVTGGVCVTATQTGVTAGTDAELHAGGSLTINEPIHATDVVRLEADTGSITQNSVGVITADSLSAQANGLIDLCHADNDVTTFAATSTTDSVYFHDINDLTIGSVTGGTCITGSQTGITAAMDVEILTGGSLTIDDPIQAGGTIRLEVGTGSIMQGAGGTIIADSFGVVANGPIDFCGSALNDVNTFAALSVTSYVYFHDANSFTVGTVTGGMCVTTTVIGVTAGTDAELHATDSLTLDAPVQATNVVRLEADNGAVTQIAAGFIKADSLSVQANGLIDLCQSPTNDVNTFAATSDTSSIYFRDVDDVTIDTVAAGVCVTTSQTGVTAFVGAEIHAGTDITINQPIQATNVVRLWGEAGQVTQIAAGVITSDTLSVRAGTTIQLGDAINNVRNFTATASGDITFLNQDTLAVNLDVGGMCVNLPVDGVKSTAGGTIKVITLSAVDGTLSILRPVDTIGIIYLTGELSVIQSANVGDINTQKATIIATVADISRVSGVVVANQVNLIAVTYVGHGTIDVPTLELHQNVDDWSVVILNGNSTGIFVQTTQLNISAKATGNPLDPTSNPAPDDGIMNPVGADVFVDVDPLNPGSTVDINPFGAGGDVVITSGLGNNLGTLNANQIVAAKHILIQTDPNNINIAVGQLTSLLIRSGTTNTNAIAVDAGGTLSKLSNYQIITGNMLLLQLLQDATFGRFNASDSTQLHTDIYKDYNSFFVKAPFPSPQEAVIRPLEDNAILATYGITNEFGWNITIDWGDPSPQDASVTSKSHFPPDAQNPPNRPNGSITQDTTTTLSIPHFYQVTGTASYNIDLTVAVDPSISLTDRGSGQVVHYEQQTLQMQVTVSAVPIAPKFFLPPENPIATRVEILAASFVNVVQPLQNPPPELPLPSETLQVSEQVKYLKLFFVPEDGSGERALKVGEGINREELSLDVLDGGKLLDIFKTLDDGKYRLKLYRAIRTTGLPDDVFDERTVLETVIKDGVPTNPLDEAIERLRRDLNREIETPQDATPDNKGANLILPPAPEGSPRPEVSNNDVRMIPKPIVTAAEVRFIGIASGV